MRFIGLKVFQDAGANLPLGRAGISPGAPTPTAYASGLAAKGPHLLIFQGPGPKWLKFSPDKMAPPWDAAHSFV